MAEDEVERPGDTDPRSGQPGLQELRAAVARRAGRLIPARFLPGRPDPKQDGVAGLNVAIANVPDGLANGALVGVNPVFGLYAAMVGPFVGGLVSSTRLMVVTTTAAASLTTGQALVGVPGESREALLFVMVVVVGVIQVVAGLLRLGRFTRFVSYSVTTGFLTGVAALLVLSQLPTAAGVEVEGGNRVRQTIDLIGKVGEIEFWAPALAVVALLLAIFLPRTRVGSGGRLIAIAVPSVIILLVGIDSVQTVADVGQIEEGIPMPDMPSFGAVLDVLTGAFSVALVILVQGTGVSQSVPNQDGPRSRISRDFIAQGAANIVSGFFRGLPVGGSVSATALSVMAGARTRWAAIFAGLWMAVLVIGVPGSIGVVAMPALGALLILAGLSSIRPSEVASVWDSGIAARLAGGTTFLATLFLPIQIAVGLGVVLSALLFLGQSYTAIRVVEVRLREDQRLEEHPPRSSLEGGRVTMFDVYGDLFYAGARTLEERLPSPRGARNPVVVLRLRGRAAAGATLVDVIARYARALEQAGGRLYLTGIEGHSYQRLARAEKLRRIEALQLVEATSVLGASTFAAVAEGRKWLEELEQEREEGDE